MHGGNITIKSDAQAITEWTSVEGIVTTALDTILGMAAGFNVGLVDANANSAVTIANGANIVASGDVNITSSSTRTATSIQATFLAVTPGQLAAVYGELTGEAKAEIASGASIKAGGALNVQASSENTLDVSAYSFSDNSGSYFSTTLASGHVDVETSAEIAQGANIDAGSLSLKAKDENDFAVTAGAWANGNGVVGLAVAVSEIDTAVSATLGADVEAAGAISVIADSATSKNRSSSAATTGDGIASKVVFGALDAAGAAASWAAGKSNQASDRANQKAGSTSGSPVKLGSSVSVNITEQDATAAIADDAVLNTGGDVAVLA
ncbi:MAG: hypothetical protein IRY96_10490, partial [Burkholderiales bacterium]|nr:hypothetical protein [Burkholderiales bacterium]